VIRPQRLLLHALIQQPPPEEAAVGIAVDDDRSRRIGAIPLLSPQLAVGPALVVQFSAKLPDPLVARIDRPNGPSRIGICRLRLLALAICGAAFLMALGRRGGRVVGAAGFFASRGRTGATGAWGRAAY